MVGKVRSTSGWIGLRLVLFWLCCLEVIGREVYLGGEAWARTWRGSWLPMFLVGVGFCLVVIPGRFVRCVGSWSG